MSHSFNCLLENSQGTKQVLDTIGLKALIAKSCKTFRNIFQSFILPSRVRTLFWGLLIGLHVLHKIVKTFLKPQIEKMLFLIRKLPPRDLAKEQVLAEAGMASKRKQTKAWKERNRKRLGRGKIYDAFENNWEELLLTECNEQGLVIKTVLSLWRKL